jgi:hypothetical protein
MKGLDCQFAVVMSVWGPEAVILADFLRQVEAKNLGCKSQLQHRLMPALDFDQRCWIAAR